jgi:hypothetical protein
MPCSLSVARTAATPPSILYGLVRDVPRMVPAPGQNAATLLDVERASQVLGQAPPAVTESDEAVAMLDFAFAHDGPDDGIKPGQSSPPPVSTPTRIITHSRERLAARTEPTIAARR